jgi:hypothetical protein
MRIGKQFCYLLKIKLLYAKFVAILNDELFLGDSQQAAILPLDLSRSGRKLYFPSLNNIYNIFFIF